MPPEPKLDPSAAWYLVAFNAIELSRQQGSEAPQPITLAEIALYMDENGIASRRTRRSLVRVVKALDIVALRAWADRSAARRAQADAKKPQRGA